ITYNHGQKKYEQRIACHPEPAKPSSGTCLYFSCKIIIRCFFVLPLYSLLVARGATLAVLMVGASLNCFFI
ncbi:MAG: hypothetical protein O7D30_11285, partial [Rickettsia endosymbiont of Ixodes persulcatus]|nr:hypothetical protein [Rickettsia endosymbiont of Ixodes persulcatus]